MEFEEFLKKNTSDNILKLAQINVKDLGEWAWKEYRKQTKHFTLYESHFEELATFLNGEYNGLRTVYLEIAVACLGKEEIEKRLKEVKK